MRAFIKILLVLAGGVFAVWFFYQHSLGINMPLFNFFLITVSLVYRKPLRAGITLYVISLLWLATAFSCVFYASTLAISMNIFLTLFLLGLIHSPGIRSLAYAFLNAAVLLGFSFPKMFSAPFEMIRRGSFSKTPKTRLLIIILIIISVVILFAWLYALSNPVFSKLINQIFGNFFTLLGRFFRRINFYNFHLFLFGCILLTTYMAAFRFRFFANTDEHSSDNIIRLRNKLPVNRKFQARRLRTEYRLALYMMIALNILILIFNIIDVKWVWFGFVWDGDFLKPFVHNGTFILILTILLSIVIVLLFFRKNLNFYSKSGPLKMLVYLWLLQNFITATSAAMRTVRYVEHFNLAYLRIGLFFFLLAVVFGLITVAIKIYRKKSAYFLIRYNLLFVFAGLSIMSLFNWDIMIARYNIKHAEDAYFHRDFMVSMPDRVLPELIKNQQLFDHEFAYDMQHEYVFSEFRHTYYNYNNYHDFLRERLRKFDEKMKNRQWQSWNAADYYAWKELQTLPALPPAKETDSVLKDAPFMQSLPD